MGFLPGLIVLAILFTGIYVGYLIIAKRETTKALVISARLVLVFLAIFGLAANAAPVLHNLNMFSRGLASVALDVGVSMTSSNQDQSQDDNMAAVEDMMHDLLIHQPWLMLHFGTANMENIINAEVRVSDLLEWGVSGNDDLLDELLRREIEGFENQLVSGDLVQMGRRLGKTLMIFAVNLVISFHIVMLALMILHSQILLIVYFILLFFSLIFSLFPGFHGLTRRGVEKFAYALLLRLGYTLIFVLAFSLSTLVHSVADGQLFFFAMLFQILVFVGLYKAQDSILSMLQISSGENHNFARSVGKPFQQARRTGSRVLKSALLAGGGFKAGKLFARSGGNNSISDSGGNNDTGSAGFSASTEERRKSTRAGRAGQAIGNMMDAPSRLKDRASMAASKVKSAPTNIAYAGRQSVSDFKESLSSTPKTQRADRKQKQADYNASVADKRAFNKGQASKSDLRDRTKQGTTKGRPQDGLKPRLANRNAKKPQAEQPDLRDRTKQGTTKGRPQDGLKPRLADRIKKKSQTEQPDLSKRKQLSAITPEPTKTLSRAERRAANKSGIPQNKRGMPEYQSKLLTNLEPAQRLTRAERRAANKLDVPQDAFKKQQEASPQKFDRPKKEDAPQRKYMPKSVGEKQMYQMRKRQNGASGGDDA